MRCRKIGRRPGLAVCVAALAVATRAAAVDYVAPPPPQAVLLRGVSPGEHQGVFLSKLTPEELRAFYAAKLGTIATPSGFSNRAVSRVLLSYQQVVDRLLARHGDVTLAEDLRVTVEWRPPAQGQASCAGDFLRELFTIAKLQHRDAEFAALCQQYGYLQNAYFQRVPDPGHPGTLADAGQLILARAHGQHGGQQVAALGQTSSATAQQIAQLALSGRASEANALAQQLTHQANQASAGLADWDGWIRVVKDADAQGYRTRVTIPTNPSTW